jgi:peroxiredoxin
LADFQTRLAAFTSRDIAVIAVSVDTLEQAAGTVKENSLTFPVAYGLDGPAFAAQTGAFYHPEKGGGHLHATGFILDPEELVANAVYSTGPVGRLIPVDCIGLVSSRQKASK